MNKATLLASIETEYSRWHNAIARAPEGALEEPGTCGDWSAKDIVAHVVWGEREIVGMLRTREMVGSPLWVASEEDRNEEVFSENRGRPLYEVMAEAGAVHDELMHELGRISNEDLTDPARFPPMPIAWEPWKIIAGCTFMHYGEHAPQVEAMASASTKAKG